MRMDGIPERRCTGNSEKHTDSQVDEKLVLIIAYNAGHMGYTMPSIRIVQASDIPHHVYLYLR
jgi:hypothetical protein